MGIWKYVTEGPHVPIRYAHQLERELHIAKQALERFADCDLHEGNCASVEVASRRIRRVAIEALGKISTLSA